MRMTEKIVTLHGHMPSLPDVAANEVVTVLEELIAKAKAGEIVAIAYCGQIANGDMMSGWRGGSANLNWLLGACVRLQQRLLSGIGA
jgi:hypothetical protein